MGPMGNSFEDQNALENIEEAEIVRRVLQERDTDDSEEEDEE